APRSPTPRRSLARARAGRRRRVHAKSGGEEAEGGRARRIVPEGGQGERGDHRATERAPDRQGLCAGPPRAGTGVCGQGLVRRRHTRAEPGAVPIAIYLGHALVESGGRVEAEKQAIFVLSREPQNAATLHIRAATRLGEGKADEALTILDGSVRAGQSVPGETAPLRAQALTRLGKLAEAEEAYRAAVKENPK